MPIRRPGYNNKLLDDFLLVVRIQYGNSDFDSDHPVCSFIVKKYKLDQRQALWFTLLVMAYYNEASAWIAFNNSDPFTIPKVGKLPIDKNRRNLYGEKIIQHLGSVCASARANTRWPYDGFGSNLKTNWIKLKKAIGQPWGNGRFAVYNTADMVHKVCDAAVDVYELENHGSSGPADAIWRISNCDRDNTAALDSNGETIYRNVLLQRIHPTYTQSDHGTIESVLCNFSGMCRGKYYPGRNIDRQQDRLLAAEKAGHTKLMGVFWEARKAAYPAEWLGEENGWTGVHRPLMQHYLKTGEILCSKDFPPDER